jgi:glycolate oxidase
MSSLLTTLVGIVGEDYATDAETTRKTYALTQSPNLFFFPDKFPDYVVYPQTAEQVSDILKLANKTLTPVIVRGSGTSSMSGNLALNGGILMDMRHMDRILEINEGNMVVVAEGGTSCYKVIHACHERGLMLPLAPEWQAAPQIGANIATNATGWHMNRTGRIGADW